MYDENLKMDPKNPYHQIFVKLFGVSAKKAMIIHRLACMDQKLLEWVMEVDDNQLVDMQDKKFFVSTYKWVHKELFKKILNLDSNANKWVRSLVRLFSMDQEALDFIGNELDISS